MAKGSLDLLLVRDDFDESDDLRYPFGMTRSELAPDVERKLAELRRDLDEQHPNLATRLDDVVDSLRTEPEEPAGYMSTGQAAAALGVSANTVKKWVRFGFIRDFWTLPGSGYIKIASSEVDRIKAAGRPQVAEDPR